MIPLGAIPGHHAARLGGRAAVTHDGVDLDWPSLDAAANRFANALRARGVVRDDLVTIAAPNGNAFFTAVFGVWKLGATPNLVPAKIPPTELRSVLQVVRPRLVICVDIGLAAAFGGAMLEIALGARTRRSRSRWRVIGRRWDPAAAREFPS